MMIQLIQAVTKFNMAPEDGSMPGEPLSAAQTALYFVGAPVGIFLPFLSPIVLYLSTFGTKSLVRT